MRTLVAAGQWVVLGYFIGLHVGYIGLNVAAFVDITRSALRRVDNGLPVEAELMPPVTIVVPAYNEQATIVSSVQALLQLTYPNFEVLVVNDGSTDGTLEALVEQFDLVPYAEAYRDRIRTEQVNGFYVGRAQRNLRVVDKENGGKADAVNVGINAARSPLFCTVDADSILQRDSLQRVVQPFIEDTTVVASGGTIRIANGCDVRGGFVERHGLPRRPLPLFQVMEYLRAFLFGRLGWSSFNGLLVLSGAFGVFRKEDVVAAGGYRKDTVGEDMELVVRLHRVLSARRRPYRVAYVPDPICWTEAPESLRMLGRQRIRWQRGLAESLTMNRGFAFRRGTGVAGWVSYPFQFFFEMLGPVIEVLAYVLTVTAWATGVIDDQALIAFALVAIGLGMALSASALVLEELSFHIYPRARDLVRLVLAALGENLGYRQLNSVWRLVGLARFLFGRSGGWGKMERTASWQVTETGEQAAVPA